MTDALELQASLEKARDDRITAEWHREQANKKAAELLAQVAGTPGITMTDAASALGVSRYTAYELLKG